MKGPILHFSLSFLHMRTACLHPPCLLLNPGTFLMWSGSKTSSSPPGLWIPPETAPNEVARRLRDMDDPPRPDSWTNSSSIPVRIKRHTGWGYPKNARCRRAAGSGSLGPGISREGWNIRGTSIGLTGCGILDRTANSSTHCWTHFCISRTCRMTYRPGFVSGETLGWCERIVTYMSTDSVR
jgi:hypothetical protein